MSLRIGSVLFIVTCVAQLAYPASMIVGYERTLRTGTPVRIRCQAVDPSDPGVVDRLHLAAHDLRGHSRFFCDGVVGGSGADH